MRAPLFLDHGRRLGCLTVSTTCHSYEDIFGVGYGVVSFSVTGANPERQLAGVLHQQLAEKRKTQKQQEDPM